jgi:outer membrane biosynthesis protein TonB
MLSGCAAPLPSSPAAAKVATASPPPAPAVVRRPQPIPLPEHKPAPPSAGESVAMAAPQPAQTAAPPSTPAGESVAMAAPQPAPTAAAAAHLLPRRQLIGIDQRAAKRLFGAAAEVSEEPPATIWRWRSADCELDLYFYLDLRSGQMRSLHYVFKRDAAGQDECVKSLAAATRR